MQEVQLLKESEKSALRGVNNQFSKAVKVKIKISRTKQFLELLGGESGLKIF